MYARFNSYYVEYFVCHIMTISSKVEGECSNQGIYKLIFSSDTCWSNHNAVSLNATCAHRREPPGTRSDYLCLQNKCCVMKLINNSCL